MPSAPICSTSRDQDIGSGTARHLPAIPLATDLQSAIAAINAIRQWLQQPPQYRVHTPGGAGGAGPKTQSQSKNSKEGDWTEQNRSTETVRVENPDDPDQFVEIERINSLTMKEAKTGHTWTWRRE